MIDTSALRVRPVDYSPIGEGIAQMGRNLQMRRQKEQAVKSFTPALAKAYKKDEAEVEQLVRTMGPEAAAQFYETVSKRQEAEKQREKQEQEQAAMLWSMGPQAQRMSPASFAGFQPGTVEMGQVKAQQIQGDMAYKQAQTREANARAVAAERPAGLDLGSEFEARVQAVLAKNPRMSVPDAIQEASWQVYTDRTTGQNAMVNILTKETRPLDSQGDAPLSREALFSSDRFPQPPANYFGMMNASTTGVLPAVRQGAQSVIGQAGIPVADPEAQKQRQSLISANRNMINSMRKSPRYAEAEFSALQRDYNLEPSALTDPQTLRQRARAVAENINRELDYAIRDANDETLSQEDRKVARRLAREMSDYLYNLNLPQADAKENSQNGGEVPAGVDPADWKYMTPEERALF